jgi:hypothetical protein
LLVFFFLPILVGITFAFVHRLSILPEVHLMFRTSVVFVAVLGLFSTATPPAKADLLTFAATLTGDQEVPSTGSPGIGHATLSFDTNTHNLQVHVAFSGLLGNTIASHIHAAAPPGASAGVATQVPTFVNLPLGVTSGAFDQTLDMTLASSYNPAFITAHGGTVAGAEAFLITNMSAGLTYLNIHTDRFPGGEIRGQIAPVPAPPAVVLAGLGAGCVAVRRYVGRRRATA